MGQIGADKKLELVRQVRMESHHNRNTLSNREYLLYGKPRISPTKNRLLEQPVRELYGLEATTADGFPDSTDILSGNMLKSFKARLIIAVVIFAVYVFIDQANIDIFGINAARIHEMINNGFEELTGLFVDLVN